MSFFVLARSAGLRTHFAPTYCASRTSLSAKSRKLFEFSGFGSWIHNNMKKDTAWCPFSYGALGGTRTHDLLVRSQTLYPTELRAHTHFEYLYIVAQFNSFVKAFWKKSCKNYFFFSLFSSSEITKSTTTITPAQSFEKTKRIPLPSMEKNFPM